MQHCIPAGLALGALALTAACSDSSPPAQAKKPPPRPALVELGVAEPGSLKDGWRFLGQVESALSSELAAAVAGHVVAVKVREGDQVAARQVLISLDSAKIRAELAAARAKETGLITEVKLADRQLERVSKLEYPTISEPERERFELSAAQVKAQLATQRAEIQRLQVELGRHTVRAPFAGVISARHVDPGAWVSAGQPVLGLVATGELEILAEVSADLGGRISVGEIAKLVGARDPIEAEIAGIVGALNTDTRTMRVRLIPKQRPAWLLAGMAVDVEFAVEMSGDGVTVPRDALVRGPASTRLYKFADGQGIPIKVDVLATARDKALVRGDGLAAGDQIVIRGNERLRPGQPLRPRTPGEDKPARGKPPGRAP